MPDPISSIPTTWPPTPATLAGHILAGTPTFHCGQDGFSGVREVLVPWDKIDDAMILLMPPSTFTAGVQTVQYGAPFPGRPYLRVTEFDVKPLTNKTVGLDTNGDYKYEFAKFVIKYAFLKNLPSGSAGSTDPRDPVPLMKHRWSIGAEVIKTSAGGLCWDNVWDRKPPIPFAPYPPIEPASGGRESVVREFIGRKVSQGDMKQGPREYVALIEHEVTRERVPRPPFSAIRECVGKCNNAVVELRTGRIPTECLILWGAHLELSTMSNGEESWNMSMRFGERRVIAEDQLEIGGWNHFYREEGPFEIKQPAVGPPSPGMTGDARSGKRGFYRLEKSYDEGEIKYPVSGGASTGTAGTNLTLGYNEDTALIKQRDFRRLWLPEPIPATGP